jgi:two-component system chemotaxis response regulator CheB
MKGVSPLPNRDLIAIGGSAGSSSALQSIVAGLPADLPASVFIATHIPSESSGYLAGALARSATLPVAEAIDGQPIERGRIYVAVPNRHLLVIDGTIRLGDGPRENLTRPAIDPLFRSAALSYGSRVIGVVLSGMLNDGAAGLWAIKACGGTAVVQNPLDAQADQMPLAALETVAVDEVAPASDLAGVLARLATSEAGESHPPPDSIELEVEIAAGGRTGADTLRKIADPSALTCPECDGVLSEIRDGKPLRYRCQIGHAQTAEVLESRTGEVEEALHVALRIMEERVTLVTRMAEDAARTGRNAVADLYRARAEEYARYAATLRQAAVASMRAGTETRQSDPTH